MSKVSRFINHLRSPLWKVNVDEEVDTELDLHVEMRTRELMDKGMNAEEARARALARFGNVDGAKTECRRVATSRDRRMSAIEYFGELRQDLSFAIRQMRLAPGWTLLLVISLVIGIGANTVVFSVVNGVVLLPLPYPDVDQLVRVRELTPDGGGFSTSDPNFLDFRDRSRTVEYLAAMAFPPPQLTLLGEGEPLHLDALATTADFFNVLGISPLMGRTFLPGEDAPGNAARVLVLSHGLWQRSFGGDTEIAGRVLNVNGENWNVIGVMPANFNPPVGAEAWVPYAADPGLSRGDHRLEMFGRLRPGVSVDQAREDLEGVAARLSEEYPDSNEGWSASVMSFSDWIIGPQVQQTTLVLQLVVGLMLLLACANVSNLLIARATTRGREISIRTALGAGRMRILRQLLTESALLAMIGAALGLLLTLGALPLLTAWNPNALPRLDEVSLDRNVLIFALLVSIAAGLISGLAPAIHASRGNFGELLKGGRSSAHASVRRFRDVLVVGEIALAMTLLIGAGLLVNSFYRLGNTNPGFDPANVLLAPINLPASQYQEMDSQTARFYGEVLERVEAIPGVRYAGVNMVNPFSGFSPSNQVANLDATRREQFVRVQWRSVSVGYFRALGITIKRGRLFDESDRATPDPRLGRAPVIISERLAERIWPDGDPIGQTLQWGEPGGTNLEVVGVVTGVRDNSMEAEPEPMVFFNYEIVAWPQMTVFVKTEVAPGVLAPAVRQAIWEVDGNLPAPALVPLQDRVDQAMAGPRFNSRLLMLFAIMALLMASLGIYGVISYAVKRRRREIGIRMTLGAHSRGMISLVLRHAVILVAVGMAIGIPGAVGFSRFLGSLLYQTSPTHLGTYTTTAGILAVVALAAGSIPALRASKIDPCITLREE